VEVYLTRMYRRGCTVEDVVTILSCQDIGFWGHVGTINNYFCRRSMIPSGFEHGVVGTAWHGVHKAWHGIVIDVSL